MVVRGKLTSKLKTKEADKNYVVNPNQEVHNLKEGESRFLLTGI